MNPCTLGWYLPILVRDVPGAMPPSERGHIGPGLARAGPNGDNARGANGASSDDPSTAHRAGGELASWSTRQGQGQGRAVDTKANSVGARQRNRKEPGLGGVTWQDLDAKFRRDLPDEAYAGRLGYRGLVMRACPAIRVLDGVEVSAKERDKAERLLTSVLDKRGAKDGGH